MKKIIMKLGLAAAVVFMAGQAYAATNTVNVTANVVGTCRFNGGAIADVAFGALDPVLAPPVNRVVTTTFWCTKNTLFSVAGVGANDVGPQKNMLGTAYGELIPYTLTLSDNSAGFVGAGRGAGPGTSLTLTLTGDLLGAAYANASEDAYADLVTVTLLP